MNWIKFKIHIFCEYYQDRKAWFKSLFSYKKVSRKFDDHFYFMGRLFSEYDWIQRIKTAFGDSYIAYLNEVEFSKKRERAWWNQIVPNKSSKNEQSNRKTGKICTVNRI